jgi:uncharacterized integral membrane protein
LTSVGAAGQDERAADGPTPPRTPGERRFGMTEQVPESKSVNVKAVVAIVLAVLALVFVFQNTSSRRVHLFFWSLSMPTWIWLLAVFLIGAVAGSLFPWLRKKKS